MLNSGRPSARRAAPGKSWWKLGAAFLLIASLCVWSSLTALAQQGAVTVVVDPADISVAAGEKFTVNIEIRDVQDLGAFELMLRYDPALMQVDTATMGEFIGSTERDVLPLGPSINAAEGRLDIGALTTGALPGGGGKGVLVTLSCTALRAGQGQLSLAKAVLSDTQGQPIAATAVDGKVTFTGDVIVPTATAAPVTPTLTPEPLPPTATLFPTATALPPSSPVATTAAVAQTETVASASATPEPMETQLVRVMTATAQAWRTAEAQWTATPTATATLEPGATREPTTTEAAPVTASADAGSATPPPASTATPAPETQSNTGLVVGLGAAAVALGAGGVVLWRRGRSRSS